MRSLLALLVVGACATGQPRRPPPEPIRPNPPPSFSQAKRIAEETIYPDHRITLYCGCDFTEDKEILPESCGYVPADSKFKGALTSDKAALRQVPDGRMGNPGPYGGNYRRSCRNLVAKGYLEKHGELWVPGELTPRHHAREYSLTPKAVADRIRVEIRQSA